MARIGLAVVLGAVVACGGKVAVNTTAANPGTVDVAQLWQQPDGAPRDLFAGPGGSAGAPTSDSFAFVAEDTSGFSPGFDVRDARGTAWSVKLGAEAQSEIAASRLLWGIGYHQPPSYYVAQWTLTGERIGVQSAGRFRPEIDSWKPAGEWSWYENPFTNTAEFRQLLVANVLLNNWDWKTSNNRIYDVAEGGSNRRVYVVRDLGASLGKTSYPRILAIFPTQMVPQGSRNDIDDFEAQGFIKGVAGGRVEFDYGGIHGDLLETVTAADVVRTSELLAGLTEAQLDGAFRAAGYAPELRQRFVAKLKTKIAEGLKLQAMTR